MGRLPGFASHWRGSLCQQCKRPDVTGTKLSLSDAVVRSELFTKKLSFLMFILGVELCYNEFPFQSDRQDKPLR